jgi:hypothetical protein
MVCQYPEPGGIWIDFGLDALRGLTMECPSFRRGECFVDFSGRVPLIHFAARS